MNVWHVILLLITNTVLAWLIVSHIDERFDALEELIEKSEKRLDN